MQSSPLYSMEDLDKALPSVRPSFDSVPKPSVLGRIKVPSEDPFGVSPVDYKTKCLNVVTEALRVVINYVHFSKRWPRIVFMCKKVDGKDATWHATDPNSRSEGYDIYHLAKHMSCGLNLKFYSSFLGISDFVLSEYCNLFVALRNPLDHAPFLTMDTVNRQDAELVASRNAIKKAIHFLTMMTAGPEVKQIAEIRVSLASHLTALEDMQKNLNEYTTFRQRQHNLKAHLDQNEPICKKQVAHSIVQQLSQKINDPAIQDMLVHIIGPRLDCSDHQILDSWFCGNSTTSSPREQITSPRSVQTPADSTVYDMFQARQPPRNPSPPSWEKSFNLFDPLGTKEWGNFSTSSPPPPPGVWSYDQSF